MTVIDPNSTETPETPEGDTSGTPEPESGNQGLVEARDRYRTERDSAREELTAAAARIERMQRAEIERLVADELAVPGDFWLSENTVADYLTDDGEVDTAQVSADAKLLLTERPRLGKHTGAFDPTQGLGGRAPKPPQPTWGAVFKS
ncbi:hypothetical protein [Mycobacterium kyogaense]|uniref:hypothetical protein n=1 Tax=Mycobacterium kyogaense TaxID=2212479 RepID=UPI000DACF847|nr:hypothetical protein [Mycobacterium kyogaense]